MLTSATKSMRNMIFYWALTTVLLCTGYVVYVRTLPPDELLVSLLVVGGPSLFVLFVVLFVDALFRRRRTFHRSRQW
jgi:hypothetical protein